MQEVKIGELKARLSHYLRLVQQGDEVLVKDRDRPVARLVSCNGSASRLDGIPLRMTRQEAEKILAKRKTPKLNRKVVDDTLRWMQEDRGEQWVSAWRK